MKGTSRVALYYEIYRLVPLPIIQTPLFVFRPFDIVLDAHSNDMVRARR